MKRLTYLSILLSLLMLTACVKHDTLPSDFKPVSTFSGRLLVIAQNHRFQVEIDWQGQEGKGELRLTHAITGRVVYVVWQNKHMRWRDNQQALSWQPLSEQDLLDMGVILPPWTLAKVFAGEYPKTMYTKDGRMWQGLWHGNKLQIKWADDQSRVELTDFKRGKRAVVIFDES